MDHYIVSARKYRPSTFASVVGQKALTATLKNAIATGRLAHSYLFCGSRGVGKTSCARIFAKTINCMSPTPDGEACNVCDSCRAFNEGHSMNIIELDAASNNGVDDIRTLVDQVQVPPSQGRYRVFIVDEVHMLSAAAFNAFLKTLEEPPSYVIFVLATTEKHKIIPTILSRCQIYDFNRISVRDMIEHLSFVAAQEGMTAEPSALNVIARKADGAMRDALSIFDQVAASSRGRITYQSAIENLNVLDYNYYSRLLDCFLEGRVLDSWLIYKDIRDRGFDSHFFIVGLADYLRDLMVARDASTVVLLEADDDVRQVMAAASAKCSPDFIYRAMNLCNEADLNYRSASNKQFLIELTLAKLCQLLSPAPDSNGAGVGQLQPIAGSAPVSQPAAQPVAQPAPQPAAQPAAPRPAVQPAAPRPAASPGGAPQRVMPQSAPAPAPVPAGGAPVGVASGPPPPFAPMAPKVKRVVRGRGEAVATPAATEVRPTGVTETRREEFSEDALRGAWMDFIKANPTRHIVINTMRASFPTLVEGTRYRVMVQNGMQLEEVRGALPSILSFVRDRLRNDLFEISIEMNEGEASPHTWSERQVLQHIVENNPTVRGFIEELKLTL